MTCIVAVKTPEGKLIFGAERMVTLSETRYILSPDPKISRRSGLTVGAAGDSQACDYVVHRFKAPKWRPDYLREAYFPELLNSLEKKGACFLGDNDLELIVGYAQELFTARVDSNKFSLEPVSHFVAIGSGGDVAYGAAVALNATTAKKLKRAIKIACDSCPGCGGSIDVIES